MNFEKSMDLIEICNLVKPVNVFDPKIDRFLSLVSTENGIGKEFVIPPLIATISNMMASSSIKALKTLEEGCVLYTGLVGYASTGKSSALSLIKRSVQKLEKFFNIPEAESRFCNAATVESLLFHLNRLKFVLSLWDESSTFLNSFGLYKGQNSSSYDRSIYNDLFNAPDFYRRDTANSRQVLQEPRLNICVLGHPQTFIELVKNEVNSKDDGLIQRFHLCAPDPEFLDDKVIMAAHKLILANYHVTDWHLSIFDVLDELMQSNRGPQSYLKLDDLDSKLIEKVLRFNEKAFTLNDVNQKTSLGKASDVKRVFNYLQDIGLGIVKNGKKSLIFTKLDRTKFTADFNLIDKLAKHNCSINDYFRFETNSATQIRTVIDMEHDLNQLVNIPNTQLNSQSNVVAQNELLTAEPSQVVVNPPISSHSVEGPINSLFNSQSTAKRNLSTASNPGNNKRVNNENINNDFMNLSLDENDIFATDVQPILSSTQMTSTENLSKQPFNFNILEKYKDIIEHGPSNSSNVDVQSQNRGLNSQSKRGGKAGRGGKGDGQKTSGKKTATGKGKMNRGGKRGGKSGRKSKRDNNETSENETATDSDEESNTEREKIDSNDL